MIIPVTTNNQSTTLFRTLQITRVHLKYSQSAVFTSRCLVTLPIVTIVGLATSDKSHSRNVIMLAHHLRRLVLPSMREWSLICTKHNRVRLIMEPLTNQHFVGDNAA
jgi:hypothetical protein